MKVILTEDVADLGEMGETVNVSEGYARNFLLPRGKALRANSRNAKQLEHQRQIVEAKRRRMVKTAEELKARIESVQPAIARKVGELDKIYGSVTTRDIEEALAAEGLVVERRKVQLDEPIKNLGVYNIPVKVHEGVVATLKLWVVGE